MARSNQTVKELFAGDGATVNFAIPFEYSSTTEIVVKLRDENVTPATQTPQVLNTHYTFDNVTTPTQIQMVTAPAVNQHLLVIRQTAKTQATEYEETGTFPAKSHENALDKLTQQTQENDEKLTRALLLRETTGLSDVELPQPEADGILSWDSAGTAIEYKSLTTSDATLANQAQAEAGTDNATYMSPLRVQQKITSDLATQGEAQAGTNNTQIMTPLRVSEAIDALATNSPGTLFNAGITNSVGSSALTINLVTQAGTNASSSDPLYIAFNNVSAGSTLYNVRSVTGALSITVPSGATLGHTSAVTGELYVYALDNSGTVELAVSSIYYAENELQTTVAIDATADSNALYSDTLRSNVPIRLIGTATTSQTTAGTWAATVDNMSLAQPHTEISPARGRYTLSSAQSVASGAYTTVTLNADAVDGRASNMFLSSGAIEVTRPGYYMVEAIGTWASHTSGGTVGVRVLGPSSQVIGLSEDYSTAATTHTVSCSGFEYFENGDTATLQVLQNSGSNQNIQSGDQNTRLSIVRIGP